MNQNSQKELLIEFCEQKGHCTINDCTYEICACFLFYTSWFEELLFNYKDRQGPKKNEKICKDMFDLIDFSKYDFFGSFFSERYITKNGTSNDFRKLRLSNDDKPKVEQALRLYKTCHAHSWELLWSYLSITYRFRNNMFHGSKGLVNLNIYVKQFEVINQFMHQLISDIIDNNYKGYNDHHTD